MRRFSSGFAAIGVLVLAGSAAFAQGRGRGALPLPTNLQVLPKDISTADLQETMRGFNFALGVQCNHCHVEVPPPAPAPGARGAGAPPAEGRGGRGGRGNAPAPLNFASDDKPEKKAARLMIKMVNDLNAKLTSDVAPVLSKAGSLTKVQCATCHRGIAQPEQISDVLSNLMLTKGETVAVARYKELRTKYYGSQVYDFSEPMLIRLSQGSVTANKLDDALAWTRLNLEFYPRSAGTYLQMADVYTRKQDQPQALKAVEKAVELDPENANAKRQLEELKGPPPAAPAAK